MVRQTPAQAVTAHRLTAHGSRTAHALTYRQSDVYSGFLVIGCYYFRNLYHMAYPSNPTFLDLRNSETTKLLCDSTSKPRPRVGDGGWSLAKLELS